MENFRFKNQHLFTPLALKSKETNYKINKSHHNQTNKESPNE